MSTCTAGIGVACALTAIVVSSLGLAGVCSAQAVGATGLLTLPWNIPVVIVSILGLAGTTSVGVVSGVTLGFALFTFMIASVACCCRSR